MAEMNNKRPVLPPVSDEHVNMLIQDTTQLEALLLECRVPDTNRVAQAEHILKAYGKRPECVFGLTQILTGSQDVGARQLSSILLRKRITKPETWELIGEQQATFKTTILEAVHKEPERIVRAVIGQIIATVARHCEGKWEEVFNFIMQAFQNEMEVYREISMMLLNELCLNIGDVMVDHSDTLLQFFSAALQDPSTKVKSMALKACSALLCHVPTDEPNVINKFRPLIPAMLQAGQQCLHQDNDDETINTFLEVIAEIAKEGTTFLNPFMADLINFSLELVKTDTNSNDVRTSAAFVINAFAEAKPKMLGKSGMVPMIIGSMMEIIAKSEAPACGGLLDQYNKEEEEEEEEEDEWNDPSHTAQTNIDTLALSVKPKYFYKQSIELCVQAMQNQDPEYRKGGAATLAVLVEGCQEEMEEDLPQLLSMVYSLAKDPSVKVRECACFSLGQFAEHCQPEILDHHKEILPLVFELLNDVESVQLTACHVLHIFCEYLDADTTKMYLDGLMQKLFTMLQSQNKHLLEMAIKAVSSTAMGAEEGFIPYLQNTAQIMNHFMQITDKKWMTIRARALYAMGCIAVAVGKNAFAPYAQSCATCAAQSLQMDEEENDCDLKEDVFLFFANLCKSLGADFSPHLQVVVPLVLEQIKEKDADFMNMKYPGEGDDDFGSDDEDEDQLMYDIHTGMVDVKKVAILCLGEMAQYCGTNFAPYLEASIIELGEQLENWNQVIRQEVCMSLTHYVTCVMEMSPKQEWVKGELIPVEQNLTQISNKILEMILELVAPEKALEGQDATLLENNPYINWEDSPQVVATGLETLKDIINKVGPTSLQVYGQRIFNLILILLNEKHPCQEFDGGEDEEEEEEDEEESKDLIEATGDLMSVCAKVLGDKFCLQYEQFLPLILKFFDSSRSETQRIMSVGCIAEIHQQLGPCSGKYLPHVFNIVQLACTDKSENVQRNGAFAVGCLAEASPAELAPQYMKLLECLHPLFSVQDGEVVDNAAGAVARMIMASPTSLPLDQVLPVFLNSLPLKIDQQENETVYKAILFLLNNNELIYNFINQLLTIFDQALKSKKVQEDNKKKFIVQSIKVICQRKPEVTSMLDQFSPEAKAFLVD